MADNEITSITDRVTKDGSSGYKAEKGRYHLYNANACPFAHRTLIGRALKGLLNVISVDYLDSRMEAIEKGWKFSPEKNGCTPDTVNGKEFLREVYEMSHPNYKGRITVPVLFDKKTKKIVNNESAEILRMLNTEFNDLCDTEEQVRIDYYPDDMKKEIDDIMAWIEPALVYGVYIGLTAKSQEEYNKSAENTFNALDKIDTILSKQRFLTGSQITEADIKLFVVLVRFDPVYYSLSKLNKRMVSQYPNIWTYMRDMYQTGGIGSTVELSQIKEGYWTNTRYTAPNYFIPIGPELDYEEKTDRTDIK